MSKINKHERFVEKVESKFGKDVYTVLGNYVDYDTKILIKHNFCGYEWDVRIGNLFSLQSKCPNCNNKIKYINGKFKEKIFDLVGDEYHVLSEECERNTSVVTMKHNVCGFEWDLMAYSFITKKSRCPLCAGLATYTTERFKSKVYELAGDEYIVKGEYINNSTEIELFHSICENSFDVKPSNFMSCNSRCPYCPAPYIRSSGENKINTFLLENNIIFTREFKFTDCKNINKLPFDFAIFSENKELKLLIEFDGGQHYKPVEWFGGEETFERIKINDEIKNEYCRNNNIKLLRIPYWDFDNIECILNEELKINKKI